MKFFTDWKSEARRAAQNCYILDIRVGDLPTEGGPRPASNWELIPEYALRSLLVCRRQTNQFCRCRGTPETSSLLEYMPYQWPRSPNSFLPAQVIVHRKTAGSVVPWSTKVCRACLGRNAVNVEDQKHQDISFEDLLVCQVPILSVKQGLVERNGDLKSGGRNYWKNGNDVERKRGMERKRYLLEWKGELQQMTSQNCQRKSKKL